MILAGLTCVAGIGRVGLVREENLSLTQGATITAKRPNPSQTHVLTAFADHPFTTQSPDHDYVPGLATRVQVATLVKRGWARVEDKALTITEAGEEALLSARVSQ